MASPAPLSKANTTFCLDLFRKLSDNDNTANVFFSPFSISSALAMVMLGARGNTATQMSEVHDTWQDGCLKTQDCQDVHTSFTQLLTEFNKADALYALSVANRLYGEQSYQFIEDFLTQTRKLYNAELESVDFKTSSEAARVNINSWVEKQTQGKIRDMLPKDVLDNDSRLVLVNAMYFKGTWNKTFERIDTYDAKFRLNKILEMPYKGKELSMLIFLPNEIEDDTTGLEKLEKQLTYEKFVEWTRPDMMSEVEVDVKLPQFKLEETYDLKGVLKNMGMVDFNVIFVFLSSVTGMSGTKDLILSEVIHKTHVEVNEEGTEAAAATGPTSSQTTPFLFFIRHNTTMSVLFAGRFCSPV
uniref:Serpin peptidase inhibitor, clade B (ovalbumin), member 1, like 3 n=1 Tax=Lates calcarifer TaxID=8187 RepID=A0A4W6G0K9_LATCA